MLETLMILALITIAILGTTAFHIASRVRHEADLMLAQAKAYKDEALAIVNTVHEAHTSLAEQVVTLTKKQEDFKQTIQLIQMQVRK